MMPTAGRNPPCSVIIAGRGISGATIPRKKPGGFTEKFHVHASRRHAAKLSMAWVTHQLTGPLCKQPGSREGTFFFFIWLEYNTLLHAAVGLTNKRFAAAGAMQFDSWPSYQSGWPC